MLFGLALLVMPLFAHAYGYGYDGYGTYNPAGTTAYGAYGYNGNPLPVYVPQPVQVQIPVPVVVQVPVPVYIPVPVYPQLSVSCSANTNYTTVGQQVAWSAYVSGGNGNYSYTWSGSDNLSGYGQSIALAYNYPGSKSASVTVYSGDNQRVTQYCVNNVTVAIPVVYQPVYTPVAVPVYMPTPVQVQSPVRSVPVKSVTVVKSAKTIIKTPKVVIYTKNVEIVQSEKQNLQVKQNASQPTPSASPVVQLQPQNQSQTASTVNYTLANVPWGWVAALVILVLFATVMYLLFNRQKI